MRPPVARIAALPGGDDAARPLDDRDQRAGCRTASGRPRPRGRSGRARAGSNCSSRRRSACRRTARLRASKRRCSSSVVKKSVLVVASSASPRDGASTRAHRSWSCRHGGRRLRVSPLQKRSPVKGWSIRPSSGAPPRVEPDQRAPERQAEDEGAGAVDRIDHPAIVGIARGARRTPRRGCRGPGRRRQAHPGWRASASPVGGGDRIEQIASFMVNGAALSGNAAI